MNRHGQHGVDEEYQQQKDDVNQGQHFDSRLFMRRQLDFHFPGLLIAAAFLAELFEYNFQTGGVFFNEHGRIFNA